MSYNSNSINQNTWESINETTLDVLESAKAQKWGQTRIAESNKTKGKQLVSKDVVLPSSGDSVAGKPGKATEAKPSLPTPKSAFSGLKADDQDGNGQSQTGRTLGLIAIIGEVMSLQAKSNSNTWSMFWKTASQSMMMEVKFAPIIADAVKSSYNAQSQATLDQAKMSKEDGWISLGMFALTAGGGAAADLYDSAGDASDAAASKLTDSPEEEPGLQDDGTGEKGTNMSTFNSDIEDTELDSEEEVNNTLNQENQNWKDRLKTNGKKLISRVKSGQANVASAIGKGVAAAQVGDLLSRGFTGAFVDSKYNTKIAAKQGEQGQAQALEKEGEQYAQFYGQAFSRSDTLTQGMQQMIDYSMNILKSAADTITSTVKAMYQG